MRLAALGLGLALGACVIREAAPVNPGYGYPYGYAYGNPNYEGLATVGEPSPYEVTSQAPEPLDDQMTPSPGEGFDWIDGYWHWNGYDWVWVGGRWERDQEGYVYVQPYYDYSGASYVYTPGYWAPRSRIPRGWNVRGGGNGHPATLVPPVSWHNPTRPIHPLGGTHPIYGGGGTTTTNLNGGTVGRPQGPTSVGGYQQLPSRQQPIGTPAHNAPGPIEGGREPVESPIIYDRPSTARPAGPSSVERPSGPPVESGGGARTEPAAHPAEATHPSGSHTTNSGSHHH
jgi:WXXGXW repeat (2 copies)